MHDAGAGSCIDEQAAAAVQVVEDMRPCQTKHHDFATWRSRFAYFHASGDQRDNQGLDFRGDGRFELQDPPVEYVSLGEQAKLSILGRFWW